MNNLVQVAKPYDDSERKISTVAICAGSGGSMFEGIGADLFFTGEMQHVRRSYMFTGCYF